MVYCCSVPSDHSKLFSLFIVFSQVVRFQTHMILLETTSIFFCFAWFARNFGYEGSFFVTAMEICFAAAFFLLRILHLSGVIWALRDVLMDKYPALFLIFIPLLGLQVYWFIKIVTYKKKPAKKSEWKSCWRLLFWNSKTIVRSNQFCLGLLFVVFTVKSWRHYILKRLWLQK